MEEDSEVDLVEDDELGIDEAAEDPALESDDEKRKFETRASDCWCNTCIICLESIALFDLFYSNNNT